jgi:hypothetical protein
MKLSAYSHILFNALFTTRLYHHHHFMDSVNRLSKPLTLLYLLPLSSSCLVYQMAIFIGFKWDASVFQPFKMYHYFPFVSVFCNSYVKREDIQLISCILDS